MAAALLVVAVLLLALLVPLAVYVLVQRERDQREPMDRQSAEETARRDTQNRR